VVYARKMAAKRPGPPVAMPGGAVNHPRHYNEHPAGIECIDVIEHMTSNVASAFKYGWRAGLKPSADHDEDLGKAIWYLQRERERLKQSSKNTAAFGGGER